MHNLEIPKSGMVALLIGRRFHDVGTQYGGMQYTAMIVPIPDPAPNIKLAVFSERTPSATSVVADTLTPWPEARHFKRVTKLPAPPMKDEFPLVFVYEEVFEYRPTKAEKEHAYTAAECSACHHPLVEHDIAPRDDLPEPGGEGKCLRYYCDCRSYVSPWKGLGRLGPSE